MELVKLLFNYNKPYPLANEYNLQLIVDQLFDVSLYNQIDEDLEDVQLELIQMMDHDRIMVKVYHEYLMLIYSN